jgi:hypothetical protein
VTELGSATSDLPDERVVGPPHREVRTRQSWLPPAVVLRISRAFGHWGDSCSSDKPPGLPSRPGGPAPFPKEPYSEERVFGPRPGRDGHHKGEALLFIEYDVCTDGTIELVALVNAVEENGADPDGQAWLAWRAGREDGGMGCAPVWPADLAAMDAAASPEDLRGIVERVILADRATKEEVPG